MMMITSRRGRGGQTEEDASPPGSSSSSRRFLDTQYDNRRDGGQLMIGDSAVFIDPDDNLTIKAMCLEGRWGCGN